MVKFDPGGVQAFYGLNFSGCLFFHVDEYINHAIVNMRTRMTILQEAAKWTQE